LRGITKNFGALTANDNINLRVETGEIHAILGENGAGKSTLMNILYGLLAPDSGQILIDENPITIFEPSDALAAGIAMVHQHFMLIPVFTVAENIILGHEKINPLGVLNLDHARSEIARISKEFNFDIDPDAVVETLPVGIQQRVEIIRALIYKAKVLILDEPTAVLTPQETDELLQVMKDLKKQGTSIIFITHKLREVREVADRITIIRRGKVVSTALPTSTQEELASQMVGRPVDLNTQKRPATIGNDILSISNLSVTDDNGRVVLHDISLSVRAGEIVAVAGVQGNGQTELARAILNLEDHVTGEILIDGKNIVGESVRRSLQSGIAFIPESRELDGLIGSFSIAENLILDTYDLAPNAKGFLLSTNTIRSEADQRIAEFDIRSQGSDEMVSSLSGGNKQKVVLARELSRPVKIVVASQPTRGLDVGSIEFIHEKIVQERDSSRAVLLFSTELDEVFALADRIAVMYKGSIIDIVPASISRSELGLLMAGIKPKVKS
jgi:simple sugar transport system ATP-binding protein